ncbi:DUF262 domain-containing HNH endonuclease family protein [Roseovarius sp. LXJ103]|uniref:DUF262 domain-containing protein n=1 Tax=Roseovarius carneus TaxID=2853164 RepID=UPI0015E81C1F|nr:DUF262 domain-containing protein [Roseovarius carneus]MBZ8117370.1 DUF262 domain-containing HNH endonuclease family protein [Roseovarius carneus]
MSYATMTIGDLLGDVNARYFLPAIQRPFVWKTEQIITLMDSLMKGYPISSLMFWAVDEDLKQELKIYNFVEHWKPGMQNPAAAVNGRDVTLVLDGQQRITSLLIALRGSYAEKAKHKRSSSLDAWSDKSLYIDLLTDPESDYDEDDAEFGVSYGLRFHALPPRSDHRHQWYRLGDILNHRSPEKLEALIETTLGKVHHGVTPYERTLITSTLRRLHEVIWKDEVVNYYTEVSTSVDRVLDIFVRANDGGTKLSKSDLLMSLITSKWENGSARDAIFSFVDFINTKLPQPNKITKDFVLKSCLVLCGFDVKYNVSNFTLQSIAEIERNWPDIRDALERTFRYLNGIGLNAENLSSLNAVLPIAWFLYHAPGVTLRGSSEFDCSNGRAVQRWLINSLLMGVFAGTSDRTISTARKTLKDASYDSRSFPEAKLYHDLVQGGRMTQVDERAVEDLLDLTYNKPRTFLALSLLYGDLDFSGAMHHVDHIIPRARADRRVLMSMNLTEARIREIAGAVDRLGNLQLLPGQENREKADLPFESWITGRSEAYRKRHLIAYEPDLWTALMLPEFVRSRERLIRERLLTLTRPEVLA